jgi:IS5 family transposase
LSRRIAAQRLHGIKLTGVMRLPVQRCAVPVLSSQTAATMRASCCKQPGRARVRAPPRRPTCSLAPAVRHIDGNAVGRCKHHGDALQGGSHARRGTVAASCGTGRAALEEGFLDEMNLVVPWAELVSLIAPHAPAPGAKGGRPPFAAGDHAAHSLPAAVVQPEDPAMEEALYDMALFREFVGLDARLSNLPDESTILRFRHLLEEHKLSRRSWPPSTPRWPPRVCCSKSGTVVDATLIAAPSSTKNSSGERDPEMHQTKKGNQWHFGMKAHIGVDADSGLVHTVVGTAANVNDVTQAMRWCTAKKPMSLPTRATRAWASAKSQGIDVNWHVAMRPGKRKVLDKSTPMGAILDQLERAKASIRAKVEHPFRVIKRQFGHVKVRYRGLAKNTAQLHTLFALSNLWMVREDGEEPQLSADRISAGVQRQRRTAATC